MTFPACREAVRQARRWAVNCLPGPDCPVAADVQLCVSELVTNSVLHSRSGLLPGGQVRVRISVAAGSWVRIEVRDDGPPDWAAAAKPAAVTQPGASAEEGRGLRLVRALAGGESGENGKGLYWVRLPWSPVPVAGAAPEPWGTRWVKVMERAGWLCECTGQCGRAGHRCPAGHAPRYPLHVVPAAPAGDAAAASLPAEGLVALCAGCRDGAERMTARGAAAPQPDALFPSGGGS